ncbi:Murein DD-endopeptidase MepM and murein hydrolase activator NlpD, contain LysM domain [Pedobacter terrae]|uniref:Murein DD-endopeptidase MepM and murein hydrolase activator NlpD, contain LysM domain n=1 Tax=Pedobacter terrae TaxID=405671 RepID=A0A1G8BZR7_9SPHI|nr:M23 family metallopeptidase [Pedobacter terrae]SDH38692.1 Murein DD-endopeptidase MepM and murein hydrolase activator NlpD, contain LysM domain [Pedobacter terrae]
MRIPRFILWLFSIAFVANILSCKTGSGNLFRAASPHEQYQKKLVNVGLDKTAMGSAWLNAATISTQKALNISIPYKENGYFAADQVRATAYKFNVTKGQKLTIKLNRKPSVDALIYTDVWHSTDQTQKLIASADTLNNPIVFDVDETGTYLIRLQPELLQSVAYELEITTGPSLAFPVKSKNTNSIKSYWGDGRDNNARKHEGVDIFGNFRTPVLAISEGTVTRVNENNLGGKVVWMRPKGKNYTLYYAHLDEQIAVEGQEVKIGDTLGLMGNTGNARSTPTHLHFGIYTANGAVNPLPFIDPVTKIPSAVTASGINLNKISRTTIATKMVSSPESKANILTSLNTGTILQANAATGNYYQVELPDGSKGFIQSKSLVQAVEPLKKFKINLLQQKVYDQPDSLAAIKTTLKEGQSVNLLGTFGKYQLIHADTETGWIIK